MKFQAIAIPNSLIAHWSRPYRAPQNDIGVLNESKLLDTLEQHAIQPGLYPGDPLMLLPGLWGFSLWDGTFYVESIQ